MSAVDTTMPDQVQAPPADPAVTITKVLKSDLSKSSNTFLVDPFLLTIDLSKNGRFETPSQARIKELAHNMATEGQLQPIKARYSDDVLSVTFGFHRALAAQWGITNGVLPQDFKIRYELDEKPDAKSSYLSNVDENVRRAELTVMDKAAIYHRLMTEFGMTSKDASEALGHKKQWGNSAGKLLTLPKSYQKLIHAGRMSAEMGYEVAMMGDKAHTVVDALIAKANGGPVLLPVWRDAWRKYKESLKEGEDATNAANLAADTSLSDAGLDPTTNQDDQIGGNKPKKKGAGVAGTGETQLKRSASDVKKFFNGYVEAAESKKAGGVIIAKKFLAFIEGKGTDAAMVKFMNSLAITE